jgi:hypothetical protein
VQGIEREQRRKAAGVLYRADRFLDGDSTDGNDARLDQDWR